MNFRHVFVVLVVLAAASTTFAGKPESSGPDPDMILKNLYRAHDAKKGPFFDRKNRQLAEQYFTKELAAQIVKDATAADGEVGAYDFDPLYASQDPQKKNFKIGQVEWGGLQKRAGDPSTQGSALVRVTFKDGGKQRELRFGFEQQPDKTWRISEIHYPDGTSLLKILRVAYPK